MKYVTANRCIKMSKNENVIFHITQITLNEYCIFVYPCYIEHRLFIDFASLTTPILFFFRIRCSNISISFTVCILYGYGYKSCSTVQYMKEMEKRMSFSMFDMKHL